MQLLTSQKNVLYDIILKSGFTGSMFYLEDYQDKAYGSKTTLITYNNTDFHFSVLCSKEGYFYFEFSPSQYKLIEKSQTQDWNFLCELFQDWLRILSREISIVDKWQQLKTEMPDFKLTHFNNEGNFSYNDVIIIETKINFLKEKIKKIPLTTSQAEALNQKLDYCIELSKSANKFDWGSYQGNRF